MLPDYKALKEQLMRHVYGGITRSVGNTGVLAEIGTLTIHEGRKIGGEDHGDADELRRFEHEFTVSHTDLEERGTEAIRDVVRDLHEAMVKDRSQALFSEVNKAVEATGNSVEAAGQPFSAELWIEALEKMEFSFGQDGEWKMPTVVAHPSKTEHIAKELRRLDEDAVLAKRLTALIERKKGEWRDRETGRRLVD